MRLVVAAAILALHPQGLWLVATVMLLQCVIEMCVVRTYALAVVFITAAVLTIGTGGQQVTGLMICCWRAVWTPRSAVWSHCSSSC